MRREHIVSGGGGDLLTYLRSIGCLIYLPLGYNDFKDYITGNSLTFSGNGSMTWDNNEQMYLVKNPSSSGRYIATLPFPYNSSDFENNSFTKYWAYKKKSTSGNFPFCGNSTSGWGALTLGAAPGTTSVSGWTYSDGDYMAMEGDTREQWYEGTQLSVSTTPYTAYRPNSWANNTSIIYIGITSYNNCSDVEAYAKNFMIFNHTLNASEVAGLYNYL